MGNISRDGSSVLRVSLSELVVGKVFDSNELIVSVSRRSMMTVKHDKGFYGSEPYNIRAINYDVDRGKRGSAMILCSDSRGVLNSEEEHSDYEQRLREAGL